MSLLSTAERLNTANTLKEWNAQALLSMTNSKEYFTKISVQLEAMRTNPEYTAEDIVEVEAMLTNIVNEARSLIPA